MSDPNDSMTPRDWFAGMALQGLLAGRKETVENSDEETSGVFYCGNHVSIPFFFESVAEDAFEIADHIIFLRGTQISSSYTKLRHNEWERIAKALGDKEPECSGFGYWAELIERNAEEIKKIIKGRA
jgi:hypothetical protein